jgi:hypothetical protein
LQGGGVGLSGCEDRKRRTGERQKKEEEIGKDGCMEADIHLYVTGRNIIYVILCMFWVNFTISTTLYELTNELTNLMQQRNS